MKITKEQYNELLSDSYGICFNDLPFDNKTEDKFKLFNMLPVSIQTTAIEWGFSDTVFRDDLFVFMLKNQFNMTPEEYHKSDIARNYFDNKQTVKIDYDKL